MEKFEREGPGAVGPELDRGMKLMDVYEDEFKMYENQRIEYGKLCDSLISNYS